ncbi:MAG TPA: 50S ribosomal protein L24 [Magnetospirillaceae bacterium]|nr:50S ribosomal protein L24 [Magnetospirillaceae bacterium]
MKIKTGDMVKVIAGAHRGKTAKVLSIHPKENTVKLEGIGTRKRFVKPNAVNPQGGSKDIHVGMDVSKVALVSPADAAKTTRIGYMVKKDGTKVRVATQAAKKEIK